MSTCKSKSDLVSWSCELLHQWNQRYFSTTFSDILIIFLVFGPAPNISLVSKNQCQNIFENLYVWSEYLGMIISERQLCHSWNYPQTINVDAYLHLGSLYRYSLKFYSDMFVIVLKTAFLASSCESVKETHRLISWILRDTFFYSSLQTLYNLPFNLIVGDNLGPSIARISSMFSYFLNHFMTPSN